MPFEFSVSCGFGGGAGEWDSRKRRKPAKKRRRKSPKEPEQTIPLAKAPMLKAAAATALITFDYVYDSAGQYVYYQHPFLL